MLDSGDSPSKAAEMALLGIEKRKAARAAKGAELATPAAAPAREKEPTRGASPLPPSSIPLATSETATACGVARDDVPQTTAVPVFVLGDEADLATYTLHAIAPDGNVVHTEGAFYAYSEARSRWGTVSYSILSRALQRCSGADIDAGDGKTKTLKLRSSNVAGAITLAAARVDDPEFFGKSRALLAFGNGVLCAEGTSLVLVPPAPEARARGGFDHDLDVQEKAPTRFYAFLAEVFRGDPDATEKIAFVQEFFGACLLGLATRFQMFVVLYGPLAGNGKSTLLEIISGCMPHGTTSAIAPQDMAGEYSRAELPGKRLNIVEELPDRDIFDTAPLKAICAGGTISARRPGERVFTYTPIAGHVFAANTLPSYTDFSGGFDRRVAVVTFNRSFTDDPARRAGLAQEVLAVEREAIIAWLVHGARRALARGAYVLPQSHGAAKAEWRKDSDQVALFLEARTRPMTAADTMSVMGALSSTLYREFRQWAEKNGHRPMAANKFGSRLRGLGHSPQHTNAGARYALVLTDVTGVTEVTDP